MRWQVTNNMLRGALSRAASDGNVEANGLLCQDGKTTATIR